MTNEQMQRFEERIEAARRELVRDIQAETAALTIDGGEPDPFDQAQSMNSRDDSAAKLARLSNSLADVDRALQLISDGGFGLCIECEEPIGLRRLESIPWASRCVECQGRLELQELEGSSATAYRFPAALEAV